MLTKLSPVQKLSFTVPVLQLVFATFEDEIAQPLHVEGPPMSRKVVAQFHDKANAVCGRSFPRAGLRLEKSLSLVYGRGERPTPNINEMGAKKKKLASSIISIEENEKQDHDTQ